MGRETLTTEAWRGVVIAGCAYEIAALVSKWMPGEEIPTISEIVLVASEHKWWRVGAWAFVGFAAWHFFVRPPSPLSSAVETVRELS